MSYTYSMEVGWVYISPVPKVEELGCGKKINCFSGKTVSKLGSGGRLFFFFIN